MFQFGFRPRIAAAAAATGALRQLACFLTRRVSIVECFSFLSHTYLQIPYVLGGNKRTLAIVAATAALLPSGAVRCGAVRCGAVRCLVSAPVNVKVYHSNLGKGAGGKEAHVVLPL